MCPVVATYCTVSDQYGILRAADPNCTRSNNVTFNPFWGNQSASVEGQLADSHSLLSRTLGINGSTLICYNDCTNTSGGTETDLFFFNSNLVVGRNCTSSCYERACIDSC